MGSVSQGINHFRGSLGLLQTVPSSLFGTGCVISPIAAVKPFAARIFCWCANVSVSKRMITGGDANYQICNCSPVTVTKGFRGETGPIKPAYSDSKKIRQNKERALNCWDDFVMRYIVWAI